jgi:hypothetical protein
MQNARFQCLDVTKMFGLIFKYSWLTSNCKHTSKPSFYVYGRMIKDIRSRLVAHESRKLDKKNIIFCYLTVLGFELKGLMLAKQALYLMILSSSPCILLSMTTTISCEV